MKCHGLCWPWPSQFPFLLPSFPYGNLLTIWLQTLNWNSLTILNRCIIAGEISGILFILGQHFGGLHRNQRRRLKTPGLLNRCGTHCHLLSCWLEFCRYTFLLDPKFMPSLCLRLSRFYSDSVLRFCISFFFFNLNRNLYLQWCPKWSKES